MIRLMMLSVFIYFWAIPLYAQNTVLLKKTPPYVQNIVFLQPEIPIFVNDIPPVSDSFEAGNQEDWFVFYAEKGLPYSIEIPDDSVTGGIDPQLEVFDEQGTPLFNEPFNFRFEGKGELLTNILTSTPGFYSIKVSNVLNNNGAYQLQVFLPFAPQGGQLKGTVIDQCTGNTISDALVAVEEVNKTQRSYPSPAAGQFFFAPMIEGIYTVSVRADAYQDSTQSYEIKELKTTDKNIELLPIDGCESPTPELPSIGTPQSLTLSNGKTQADLNMTVSTSVGIKEAWVIISQPNGQALPKIVLTCGEGNICSTRYDQFNRKGDYQITYHIEDTTGQVAVPRTAVVTQTEAIPPANVNLPDSATAVFLNGGSVSGQINSADQVDWYVYYSEGRWPNVGVFINSEASFQIYNADGVLQARDGDQLVNPQNKGSGFYYIRVVSSQNSASYTFELFANPFQLGRLRGKLLDKCTEAPIGGAEIALQGTTRKTKSYSEAQDKNAVGMFDIFDMVPGSYSVITNANGYQSVTENVEVTENKIATLTLELLPDEGCPTSSTLPVIESIELPSSLSGENQAQLSMTVKLVVGIKEAWVSITRPDGQQVSKIILQCDANVCFTTYDQFDLRGEYRISFHVQDSNDQLAEVLTETLTQTVTPHPPTVVIPDNATAVFINKGPVTGRINSLDQVDWYTFYSESIGSGLQIDASQDINYQVYNESGQQQAVGGSHEPGFYYLRVASARVNNDYSVDVKTISQQGGNIDGIIMDQCTGIPIAGADIVLDERKTQSYQSGLFWFPIVTPGTYDVSGKVSGYQNALDQVVITELKVSDLTLEALPVSGCDVPVSIVEVIPAMTLNSGTQATLSMTVNQSRNIQESWVIITRPDGLELPKEPLQCDLNNNICSTTFDGFSLTGDYTITFFARDQTQTVTSPAVTITQAQNSNPPVSISGHYSGSWFDRSHDGEGYAIEIIRDPKGDQKAVVTWYTYDKKGKQAWVIGTGVIVDNKITVADAKIPQGGIFGADFDPEQIDRLPWGNVEFVFSDCNHATVNYTGPNEFGSGQLNVERLSTISGLKCDLPATPATSMTPLATISGTWYDKTHDGEGFVIEVLKDNRASIFWYTYDPAGKQAWVTGTGRVEGRRIIVDQATFPEGGIFGSTFDPDTVNRQAWGRLEFDFSSCDEGVVSYESNAGFGTGTLNLTRLTSIDDYACNSLP